ncbi:hypothetical protein [Fusobacterium sp.]|uniref:hypothetical protein n=1 Tax=Fusobacterium sp. TaxID=68766 RepID=UPI00290174AF|nr:hypothetical protein [Fusobacterium sp.]MDU1911080.1 hypothetical protein [Fusobacterium sp.]
MNIKEKEKEISLKISSNLEFLIKEKNIRATEISSFIGMSDVNFSKNRNNLKRGKFPTSQFLIGISNFFHQNFLF